MHFDCFVSGPRSLIRAPFGFPSCPTLQRIGYLGLTILLDERQEVLMMVTNSLKYDMNHKHQFVVGIALTAMGNICSAGMARDLSPDIERLLENTNPYIRKKAALTAMRVVVKVPDLVEGYVDRAGELLHDRNPSVLLAGTALMLQLCELDAGAVENYRQHVPMLCKLLRVLLHGGGAADNEASGVTQPHLQVKILRLLRYLGKGNAEASDQMSDILAQVRKTRRSCRPRVSRFSTTALIAAVMLKINRR